MMPVSTPNNSAKFIDATQNAVIEVVDNVSEMINVTSEMAEIETHHYDIFYHNPTFWVGVAFILVVVFLAKPLSVFAKKALTQRRNGIVDKIKEAEKLSYEAQELLAQYERKFLHAKEEAKIIADNCTAEIKNLTDYELQKLENKLSLKQKEVNSLLEATIEKTKNEINSLASIKSIDIVEKYMAENLSVKHHEKLIDNSIKNILSALK